MTDVAIAAVTADYIKDLDLALRALSAEMGDTHVAELDSLTAAFLGDHPAFHALLAYQSGDIAGVLVWSAQFSTTRGGGGVYVSDLWVAPAARGLGVGRALLFRALTDAETTSGACFLKLAVHHTNPAAHAYYRHIGFRPEDDMLGMSLDGQALQRFKNS